MKQNYFESYLKKILKIDIIYKFILFNKSFIINCIRIMLYNCIH